MNKAQNIIYNIIVGLYKDNGGLPLDENQVEKYVNHFSSIPGLDFHLTDTERDELEKEIKRFIEINVDKSKAICLFEKDHKPWYREARALNGKNSYWNRYNNYLYFKKHYSKHVIDAIDSSTDDIMDLLGNPELPKGFGFARKGLVLGDVQSGKTGTYIGLINKAADIGYKVIILLTGVTEKLRQQTQRRVDEGFIGIASADSMKNRQEISTPVGVGEFTSDAEADVTVTCLTSTEKDFTTALANNVVSTLASIHGPIILVVKKNKSVLQKLGQWFRSRNNLKAGEKLDYSLLLIDDEADNASVNTNKAETNPTIINACIRNLLNLFIKSNYVGFTATPFANIFIKPDTSEEMENADLFPKDFIYVLRRPSNYIGPEDLFNEDGKCSFMIKNIDEEAENMFLPENHKNHENPKGDLPLDLKEAICSFFIANVIRDLRQHETTHRSMLINISRFISVQNIIADMVEGFVRRYQRAIENYSKTKDPLSHSEIAFIKHVFEKHFLSLDSEDIGEEKTFTWDEILPFLYRSAAPIMVRAVNQKNAQKNLNYSDFEETGLRVIVVGGFSLSRGLTLEGLCTSYYYRNSKMYDTLMQMGRWFGYRDHYADLCQIWMSVTARDWYQQITKATAELKEDLRRMDNLGKTPKEFGLWVRSDCASLYVTAKNKMRNTEIVNRAITFSGKIIETPYISKNMETNNNLKQRTEAFIQYLFETRGGFSSTERLTRPATPLFKDVPSSYIIDYISDINLSGDFSIIDKDLIIKFILSSKLYSQWDVAIASGNGSVCWTIGGRKITNVQRSFRISKYSYVLMGKSSRVGDTATYSTGLTKDTFEKLKKKKITATGKDLAQADLFTPGVARNPLLIIFPIELILSSKDKETNPDYKDKMAVVEESGIIPKIALGLGFPSAKEGEKPIEIKYTMNLIKRMNLLEADEDYSDEDSEADVDD